MAVKKKNNQIMLYTTADGKINLRVTLSPKAAWLSQKQMAELFNTTKQNIGQHVSNIFDQGVFCAQFALDLFLYCITFGKKPLIIAN